MLLATIPKTHLPKMSLVPCFLEVHHILTLPNKKYKAYFDSNDGILNLRESIHVDREYRSLYCLTANPDKPVVNAIIKYTKLLF